MPASVAAGSLGASPGKGVAVIGLLWALAVVFLVAWVVGWVVLHVAGGLIHILLVVALVLFLYNLVAGRSTA